MIQTDALHAGHVWLNATELLQHPDATLYVKKGLFDYLDHLEKSTGTEGYLPEKFQDKTYFAVHAELHRELCLARGSVGYYKPCLEVEAHHLNELPDMSDVSPKQKLGTPHHQNSTLDLLEGHSFYHDADGEKIFGRDGFRKRLVGAAVSPAEGELSTVAGEGELSTAAAGMEKSGGGMVLHHVPDDVFHMIARNTVLVTVDLIIRLPHMERMPQTIDTRHYLFLKRNHTPMRQKLRFLGGRLRLFETFFEVARRQMREILKIPATTTVGGSPYDPFEKYPLKFRSIVGSYTTHFEKSSIGGPLQTVNVVILVDVGWELLSSCGLPLLEEGVSSPLVSSPPGGEQEAASSSSPGRGGAHADGYILMTALDFLRSPDRADGYFGAAMERHLRQEGERVPQYPGRGAWAQHDETMELADEEVGGGLDDGAEEEEEVGWTTGPDGEIVSLPDVVVEESEEELIVT